TGIHEVHFEWDVGGRRRLRDAGTEMADVNRTTYRIADGDPLSVSVDTTGTQGNVTVNGDGTVTYDPNHKF
ncbi:Ig-like domain-containing protein, partial [Escherichia coli]